MATMATWRCAMCTYGNLPQFTSCTMCGFDINQMKTPQYDHYDDLKNQQQRIKILQDIDDFDIDDYKASIYDLELVLSDITCYNNDVRILSTLRSVMKKLLIDDTRHRTLDLTNPRIIDRFLSYKSILQFLLLTGYDIDDHGNKLIATEKPENDFMTEIMNMLNKAQQKFEIPSSAFPYSIFNDNFKLMELIECNTNPDRLNSDLLERLVMIQKMYTNSFTLFDILSNRFFVPIPSEILNHSNLLERSSLIQEFQVDIQKRIQLQIVKAIRDWIKYYWEEDFYHNNKLQKRLEEWLNKMYVYSQLDENKNCKWIPKLYGALNKRYVKQKLEHKMHSTPYILDGMMVATNYNMTQNSTQEIADQITLIHQRMFYKIKPREYIYNIMVLQRNNYYSNISYCNDTLFYKLCFTHNAVFCLDNQSITNIVRKWYRNIPNDIIPVIVQLYKAKNEPLSQNLLLFAKQFNHFVKYIQVQILIQNTLKMRIKAIKKFIRMGDYFQNKRNYYSLCAVFSALNSKPIQSLEFIWKALSTKKTQKFKKWSMIFNANYDYKNLRHLLVTSGLNNKPWIPHIGVLLNDLMLINSEICNYCKMQMCQCTANDMNHTSVSTMRKCMRIVDRIKQFNKKSIPKYNDIKQDTSLQKAILYEINKSRYITMDKIFFMS